MKRLTALFFTILILILALTSCSPNREQTCRQILGEMVDGEIGLPAGRFYSKSAQKGDEEYLSDSLIASIFGGGSYPTVADGWIDASLFMSLGTHPCEFAVILCRDRDIAHDTADILLSRLSSIKLCKTQPQYEKHLQNATVTLVGNYALLIISSDTKNAIKIFMKNK